MVERNIEIGTWYLKKLHQQFRGDVRLVLAAYNGVVGMSQNGSQMKGIAVTEGIWIISPLLRRGTMWKRCYSTVTSIADLTNLILESMVSMPQMNLRFCLSAKIALYLNGHSRMTIFFYDLLKDNHAFDRCRN